MVGLCRLCAAVRKTDVLLPMTNDTCQKLRQCFAMDLCQPGDKLPRRACASCMETLQNAFNFFKKVQESQELLTLLFDEQRNELSGNISEICLRSNEDIDAQCDTTTTGRNLIIAQDSINETNDESLSTTDALQYKVELLEERDEIEVYQVFDNEANIEAVDNTIESDHNREKECVLLSDSNTEDKVVTYFLEEDVEDLEQEWKQVTGRYEENRIEEDENDTESYNKPTVIEILPAVDDDDGNSKYSASAETNDIQQPKWRSCHWICYTCSESYNSFSALHFHFQEEHSLTDATNMKYKCADCQKICAHYHKFLNHVRFRHQPQLGLRCDACDVHQESYEQLAIHRETSCKDAQLHPSIVLCSICGKSFHSRAATLLHVRNQHNDTNNDNIKWHQCGQCEKKFKKIASLRAHENIHSGLKEFACEICDRKFRQKHNLEVHLNTHVNDKAFECKICKKSLKTSANLEKHQLIHKAIKNFICDYCDKEFRTKDAKLSHERIHTGEKPFKCQYCDRYFRFRSILMGHINVHTGERPYSCQYCDLQFTNWSNMNKHINRCHKRERDAKGT